MNRGDKVKVYFKLNERYYKLFNIIQLGKNGTVDLKITDFYNELIIFPSDTQDTDKGYLTESDIDKSRFILKSEMSYHKDGSFLYKFKDSDPAEYTNPYGEGGRWISTSKIVDFQPIFKIEVRRMAIFNRSYDIPTLKSKETAYICENEELFESNGSYFIVCYIRNKEFPVNRYTTSQGYSDIITSLNHELDLCIWIARHNYPQATPYYSEQFQCIITPYSTNSISFCYKDFLKGEMMDKLQESVFDPDFNKFLNLMTGGEFINLTTDRLKLTKQIDIFQQSGQGKLAVSKPIFIKMVLERLKNNLKEFNRLPLHKKQMLIHQWNNELKQEKV